MPLDERGRRLVDAMVTITGDLELPAILNRIVEAAAALVDARYAALGVVGDDRFLSEFVFTGMPVDAVRRIGRLPEGHGILGLLVEVPETIRLPDLNVHPRSHGFPAGHPPMRSFLGTPVRVGGQVFGNLYLTEKQGADEFSAEDEELVIALAAAAGSVIERSRLHDELRRMSLIEDRERIGRDLHDTVIQRLFATGLGLQAIARRAEADRPDLVGPLEEVVEDLDRTIRDIRTTIFALQSGDAVGATLRRQILALTGELEPALGFHVSVRFDGPIDTTVTPVIVEHAIPVLREALTNVAKHAGASRADVRVAVHDGRFTVEVDDDGTGIADRPHEGFGLGNLEQRASRLGGELAVGPSPSGGTHLRWSVPLSS